MYVRVDLSIKSRNSYESDLKSGIVDAIGHMQMSKN